MFADMDDQMLVEVMLIDSMIDDRNTKALVMFIPHGDPCQVDQAELPPAVVPARWFSELMPMSIFLDIPEDASSISAPWNPDDSVASSSVGEIKPGFGEELAARWRANKRPIATTVQYVVACHPHTPTHLLNFAYDAIEALQSGRFAKASRGRIATYCELMSRHLSSLTDNLNDSE
jgi:hypothetical protein